jgi:hypothetical protein
MKKYQHALHGIPFHEETAPTRFPVFTNRVSTRYFDVVLNSLKPVVVGEEVCNAWIFHYHVISKTHQWM